MFNKLKNIWIILFSTAILTIYGNSVNWVTIKTIKKNLQDKDIPSLGQEISDYSILGVIEIVNNYLWLAIGFFCFLFMIINWYKLISAHWDEKKVKAATGGLIWSVVWIVVCLSAYLIVNVVLKMFLN